MSIMIRIAMWSGPRNISTAMMRAWENRLDTFVVDEPFYAHYLSKNRVEHPGREEVLLNGEIDSYKVSQGLVKDISNSHKVYYQKHMTHHLLDSVNRDWMKDVINCFLIRNPKDMIISYSKIHSDITRDLLGIEQQKEIFDYVQNFTGEVPPVIDSKDVLLDPRGVLTKFCNRIGIDFSEKMLNWPKGSRDTDGIWGKYWYNNVINSTGFNPYTVKNSEVPDEYKSIYKESLKLYEDLHYLRIR
ncbi:MAG: sulfotransferase family protein [Euryarchaeota archaeon]|nr:sulfotransferase family protein [Euryarchaeota archaeon]